MMQCKVRNFMNLYAYNLILKDIYPSKVMTKFQNTFTPFSKHQGRPSWSENIVFCFLTSRSFEGIMSLFHQPSYKIKRKFVLLTKPKKHYLTFNLNTSVFFQKFVCIALQKATKCCYCNQFFFSGVIHCYTNIVRTHKTKITKEE